MHSCVIGYICFISKCQKSFTAKKFKIVLKKPRSKLFPFIKYITKRKKIIVLSSYMLNSTNKLYLGNFLFVWQLSSWSSFSTFLNTTFLNKNSTTMSLVKNLLNLVYNSTHVQTILDELEISSALGIMSPPSTTNTSSVTLP